MRACMIPIEDATSTESSSRRVVNTGLPASVRTKHCRGGYCSAANSPVREYQERNVKVGTQRTECRSQLAQLRRFPSFPRPNSDVCTKSVKLFSQLQTKHKKDTPLHSGRTGKRLLLAQCIPQLRPKVLLALLIACAGTHLTNSVLVFYSGVHVGFRFRY